MEIVRRNNNNNIMNVSKKQIAAMAATAAANYVARNSDQIIQGAIGLGKKAAKAVRGQVTKGNQQGIVHVGGVGGSIMAPVAISRQLVGSKPKFAGRTSGSVTISHREYLTQVNNSNSFTVNGGIVGNLLYLNPLNATLFKWLPSIAANFDQYVFNSIVLHYVPLCGTNEVGRVAMYWDKDSEDPEPTDRIELANFSVLKETAPWAEATLRIPIDRTKRYCDDSTVVDRKLIDLGQVGLATYGGTGTNSVGDVFVSYSITLHFPQPTSSLLMTRRLDLSGLPLDGTGPSYLIVTRTSTVLTMTFRSSGTFLINGSFRDTGVSALGLTGSVNVNSITTLDTTGVATSFCINCTVSALPSTITYTSTGITSATVHATRAVRANIVTLA